MSSRYATTAHPAGGVVIAGIEGQTLVIRHIAQDLDESFRHELFVPADYSWFDVQAVDVSADGRVVAAASASHFVGGEDDGSETVWAAIVFDETGAVTDEFELASEPYGVEYVSDTEFVVWRASSTDEIPGWNLVRHASDGSTVWQWALPARNDYRRYGALGASAFADGYLFTCGAYVGGLDFGSVQLDSAGCTDQFVARFQP